MKKFIYTAFALAAVAVGCTKSNIVDVPAEQNTPIAFDTYNGRVPVTRAEEITQGTISSIQVTGFHVPTGGSADYTKTYMNPTVTRTLTGENWGPWGYNPLSYWPATGTLEFVAYGSNTPRVETAADGKLVAIGGSYANFTYRVPETVAAQEDLIAAGKGSNYEENGKVTFEMKHLLSRVGFKLQTVGSGTSVTISEVSLNGKFVNNGTVDLSTGTAIVPKSTELASTDYTTSYSLFAEGETFSISSDESAAEGAPIFANGKSEADRFMMLMPVTVADNDAKIDDEIGTAPYIQVKYQLGSGAEQTKKLPLKKDGVNWTFAPGTAYEFVFRVSISAIEFTGEVVDWDEDINGDRKVDADDYIE